MFETAIEAPKLNKNDLQDYLQNLIRDYKWEPDKKRGRPSLNSKKGRPRAFTPSELILMEQVFSIGGSLNEALLHAKITSTAYYHWLELNPHFAQRIEQLKANPVLRARNSLYNATKFDGELSLKYLERKLPDEFSLKATVQHNVEFTGISLERPKKAELIDERTVERLNEIKPV